MPVKTDDGQLRDIRTMLTVFFYRLLIKNKL